MFVVVYHTITDEKSFFEAAPAVSKGGPGARPYQFWPSAKHDQAFCVWEADSVEAVKGFLEPKIGTSSRNIYYAVDAEKAMVPPREERKEKSAA